MSARAVVHVGTPKSGTTFLQRALWQQRSTLEHAGVFLPGERAQDMFLAAIEVRETHEFWGRDPEALAGTWARMCDAARGRDGITVLSHELLCAAKPKQVRHALSQLDGLEVDVVVTARDLGRQLMSAWQEDVKNGLTTSFEDYQGGVVDKLRRSELTGAFWRFQDLGGILERWGADLDPARVHVVVGPPAGSPPELLWTRFCEAVGFEPGDDLAPSAPERRSNETLGMEQVAVLRRLNGALEGRIRNPRYARMVKRRVAQGLLAATPGTRPVCPPGLVELLRDHAEESNRSIIERGYRVHGDLAELLTPHSGPDSAHPDEVMPQREAEILATVLAEVLVDQAHRDRGRGEAAGPGPKSRKRRTRRQRARAMAARVRHRLGRSSG